MSFDVRLFPVANICSTVVKIGVYSTITRVVLMSEFRFSKYEGFFVYYVLVRPKSLNTRTPGTNNYAYLKI